MIPFERERQETIPSADLKVIGLGGAGANMLDRAALDGMEGAELLALNTDMRTLAQSMAADKIQLGVNLTKGLGAGGDPELGKQAVLEAEEKLRAALKGRKIVFLCVGLGGGTGSGAAPIVTRIAREEGAFVVVFATMPFAFEGQRRRDQAETALNELAVLSNALVTFDNGRMGELVLAKQGIHEAFTAADRMISESIKAVTRLVLKPGLVNVGLDDLVTALKTTRSRCLFGSGISSGKNRAQVALKNALSSPLLDRGSLLRDAESVLVHVSGGESMTLYEVELLMQALTKHVPADAHILFGAAIDPAMGDYLSVTVISALPENKLTQTTATREDLPDLEVDEKEETEQIVNEVTEAVFKAVTPVVVAQKVEPAVEGKKAIEPVLKPIIAKKVEPVPPVVEFIASPDDEDEDLLEDEDIDFDEEEDLAALSMTDEDDEVEEDEEIFDLEEEDDEEEEEEVETGGEDGDERSADVVVTLKPKAKESSQSVNEFTELEENDWAEVHQPSPVKKVGNALPPKRGSKPGQTELELDGGPKGRFEGESPNLLDGEDLDVPPYLRKKR